MIQKICRRNKITKLLSICSAYVFLTSCAWFEKNLDLSGLDDYSRSVISGNPGKSSELENFIKNFSLSESTMPQMKPDMFISEPLSRFILDDKSLKMEKISFPSNIMNGSKHGRAYFYLYSRGSVENKKVMLWIPGMGVSDFAFKFIDKIFMAAISKGYILAVYVPPYHLERIDEGKSRGEGFISGNPLKDISMVLECVREIRTVFQYCKDRGASSFAAWGGSMGASMILLASQFIPLENLTIMIPVVDWTSFAISNERMNDAVEFLVKSGYTENLLISAYSLISPSIYKLKMRPDRVMIQYAENDMINKKETIKKFADRNGIKNIKSYPHSHATILIDRNIYSDYTKFLNDACE